MASLLLFCVLPPACSGDDASTDGASSDGKGGAAAASGSGGSSGAPVGGAGSGGAGNGGAGSGGAGAPGKGGGAGSGGNAGTAGATGGTSGAAGGGASGSGAGGTTAGAGGATAGAGGAGAAGVAGAGGSTAGASGSAGSAGTADLTPPPTLSATGLYADIATKTLASGVEPFAPRFVLWSDGAVKSRWVKLPDGGVIDTSDPDHWSLPVGTKLWKQFVVGGVVVETRLVWRVGPGPNDFVLAPYQWAADGSDALLVPNGVADANGTKHDIPATSQCVACHGYLSERALGFSAVQLDHDGDGVTLAQLTKDGRVSTPIAPVVVPGDAATVAALGYLHANCGNCHNPTGIAFAAPFDLRLRAKEPTVAGTGVFTTAVGVPVEKFVHPGITHRIVKGASASSCVPYRMSVRGTKEQMPPTGSEVVDDTGVAAMKAWIDALP